MAIAAGLVAVGLISSVAIAALVTDTGTHDVTVDSNDDPLKEVDIGNALVSYIPSSGDDQSSGTGIFDPFVRLQADPTEEGFNTDAPVTLDTKAGKWTHAIKVNAIPIVDCDGDPNTTATCWELFVDINENNTAKRVSLNDVEIWFTDSATLSPYPFTDNGTTTTKEYDFSGAILINDVNQGSGRGDLRYLVPTAGHTWTSDTWFVLYSQWGTTTDDTLGEFGTGGYASDGGFEEWKVRKAPNLSILKTANPAGPVNAGDTIGFDITVSNTGAADATNVQISDPLPASDGATTGTLNWSENPDNSNCIITGIVGSQVLNCTFATLASGTSVTIHIQSATTAADCGVVSNTATLVGDGSSTATVTVNCAAIAILKKSTKSGNPLVANAGAVFSVDGPDAGTTPDFSVTDDLNAAAPDEDAAAGAICVSGLAPGNYTINETTPPPGYGGASQTNVTAVAVNGTNCVANKPTAANSAVFTNAPLGEITVGYHDLGSGETSATSITCAPSGGANITPQAATDDDDIPNYLEAQAFTFNPVTAPATYTCTLVVDP